MIAAAKPMSFTRGALVARPTNATISKARKTAMVVRSAEENSPAEENGETVFYAGNTFASEEEFKTAVANGTVAQPAPASPTPAAEAKALSIGELMAFSGPAPEIINGRLCMIAVVAAIAAELSTGESVLRQWADEPTGIILTAVTFSIATLIPLLNSTKREAFGPFTPEAEQTNGRAAMLGFAALLAFEAIKGGALF